MGYKISLIPGDGVGPELIEASKKFIEHIGKVENISFNFQYMEIKEFKDQTNYKDNLALIKSSDAILLGTIDTPSNFILPYIINNLNLYSYIKEYTLFNNIKNRCNIKYTDFDSLDITLVTDTLSGMTKNEMSYTSTDSGRAAYDKITYSELEIEKVARNAYEIAEQKDNTLHLVDDPSSLLTSRLWRKIVTDINEDYPDVHVDTLTPGEMVSELLVSPEQVSVILVSNMFSRTISDTINTLFGFIENTPICFIGETLLSLYSVALGSNDMFKSLGVVNPIPMFISIANMFTLSFGRYDIEQKIMKAIDSTLKAGLLPYEWDGENKLNELLENIIKKY